MRYLPFKRFSIVYFPFALCAAFLTFPSAQPPLSSNHRGQLPGDTAIGISREPRLLSGGKVEFPVKLVKKGVEGAIEVRVEIDQNGNVESCGISVGLDPLLDSLVLSAMSGARFSPACESGKTVPAALSMRLDFNLAGTLKNSANAPAELCGVVIDRSTGKPIGGATVAIECPDTLADSGIAIGYGRYLELIGNIPGQSWYRGIISTVTDARGSFAFRLLPTGPVRVAVSAEGFESSHFREESRTGVQKSVLYYCDPFMVMAGGDSIIVYGRQERRDAVDIEERQYVSGLTTYLSEMLKSQTVITGVPEAGSLMTARGGSPFDNRYLICGVPFLAPFHFSGHPYADFDGMLVSSLKKVTVTTDRIAARFPGASGIIIEADPGIYRSDNKKLVRRPELSVDYGSLSQDFMLSVPFGSQNDDFLQLGYSGSKSSYFRWLAYWYDLLEDAAIGVSPPASMGNVTLTGTKTSRLAQIDAFGWFAWDGFQPLDFEYHKTYHPEVQKTFYPWGMASVGIHPPGREFPLVRYGGSHQYFMQGKRVGNTAFLKTVYLSNGSVSLFLDTLAIRNCAIQFDCRIDDQYWDGTVIQRDTAGPDIYIRRQGHEISLSPHTSVEQKIGPVTLSVDVLGSLLFYDLSKRPDNTLDAGASLLWEEGPFQAGLHAGRVTSRPDIRCLPDSVFRKEHLHAWLLSLPLFFNGGRTPLRLSVQPYVRYQDRAPGMDPLMYVWDEELTTEAVVEGVDIGAEVAPKEWIAWDCAINLSRADRIAGDSRSQSELNAPWTIRNNLHLNYKRRFHLYLKGMAARLAPYYDFKSAAYADLPLYMRWDINLHYRTERPSHRYLTRYDGYFNVKNFTENTSLRNTRDYYWGASMNREPIYLSSWILELGLRAGFRL
jgi:TonB family protein